MERKLIMKDFEFGVYTLGDYVDDPETGNIVTEQERINEIIRAAKLADSLGFDVFAVGESHQEHFISQAHAVILGAIARETQNIRLSSAATIVSTSDPVRIYENFATLDLLSNGRAEIIGGRASRIGLFSLLGYDVENYEELFEEKFNLLLKLNKEEVINWEGKYRKPLTNARLYPKPLNKTLPIWRAVGGHPQSARVAAMQGVPMMLATIAGPVAHFNKTVDIYRKYFTENNDSTDNMIVGITSLVYIDETDEKAYKRFYKYVNHTLKQSNGHGLNPEIYVDSLDVRSALAVGSKQTIINKLVHQYEVYRHDRHMLQLDLGGMPAADVERQIKILGEEIIPEVKRRIQEIRKSEENK